MAAERTISVANARRVYDRIGRAQDTQGFYEEPALERLVGAADLGRSRSVLEIGCGTGKFARRLLERQLPPEGLYLGLDVSPQMVAIARSRLQPWADRAEVAEADVTQPLAVADASVDRVVATYVFDLLSAADRSALLAEAERVLAPEGRLCAVSITAGEGGIGAVVSGVWTRLFALRPELTGGCRPIDLRADLDAGRWRLLHATDVRAWGVTSQVVVASRRR